MCISLEYGIINSNTVLLKTMKVYNKEVRRGKGWGGGEGREGKVGEGKEGRGGKVGDWKGKVGCDTVRKSE